MTILHFPTDDAEQYPGERDELITAISEHLRDEFERVLHALTSQPLPELRRIRAAQHKAFESEDDEPTNEG